MYVQLIILACGALINLPAILLLTIEVWKKFWLVTDGLVREVRIAPRRGRNSGLTVTVKYTYEVLRCRYPGEEVLQFSVPYHLEADTLRDLSAQYAIGERIAVYYPRRIPRLSSCAPGGRNLGQLIGTLVGTNFCLTVWYFYSKMALAH